MPVERARRVREDADGVERRRMFLEIQELVRGQPNAMRLAARLVSHDLHDLDESIGSGNGSGRNSTP